MSTYNPEYYAKNSERIKKTNKKMETPASFPITRASFMLTRSCQLACPFCFNQAQGVGDMSPDIAKRGIDFLFEGARQSSGRERNVEVSFWGGEPLLKWDLIKEMTLYAEDAAKKTSIPVQFGGTTNGVLLVPERFDFLDEHKIFFMISIDGTKDSHDLFRKYKSGKGSHDVIMKNARLALKRWPFYRVRLSPTVDRIDHFYDDMKYLFEEGFSYVMFSPVYEGDWTVDKWKIFEEQCYKVIDYMAEQKIKGRKLEVEHFKSYTRGDSSNRACGAGVFYANIDIDGAIEVCHRFLKFTDTRSWQERPYCIGHIDYGITRPDVKAKFENPDHSICGDCPRLKDTPCNGSCPASNYDFTGDPFKPSKEACNYVNVQKRVSEYYKEKLGMDEPTNNGKSCTCYNMCYLEGTDQETRSPDPNTDMTCICYNTNYAGGLNDQARPLTRDEIQGSPKDGFTQKDRDTLRNIFMDIDKRLKALEEKVGK